MKIEYFQNPTPHAFIPQLIEPELYRQIRFPELAEKPMGRIGRDLYPGEPGWAELMALSGWAKLSAIFTSEEFMQRVIALFADDIRQHNCALDPARVYLDPYQESRQERPKPGFYPRRMIPTRYSPGSTYKPSTPAIINRCIATGPDASSAACCFYRMQKRKGCKEANSPFFPIWNSRTTGSAIGRKLRSFFRSGTIKEFSS